MRGDFTQGTWVRLTGANDTTATGAVEGANSTSPHTDTQDMVFIPNGQGGYDLLQSDDGGLYRLISVNDPALRKWLPMNGDIQIARFRNVAYDVLNNVLFGGTDDDGTPQQDNPGAGSWTDVTGGDAYQATADNGQASNTTNPQVTRYSQAGQGSQLANINRYRFNRTNTSANAEGLMMASPATPNVPYSGLHTTSDTSGGFILNNLPDPNNLIAPRRMLIGSVDGLYHSENAGDVIYDITSSLSIPSGASIVNVRALTYGGVFNGLTNLDVAYVSASINGRQTLFLRTTAGGSFNPVPYPGPLLAETGRPGRHNTFSGEIKFGPDDWHTAYIADGAVVYRTTDAGSTWTDITPTHGNAGSLAYVAAEVVSPGTTSGDESLFVGGLGGVYYSSNPRAPSGQIVWSKLGSNLPNTTVFDLRYIPPTSTVNGLRGDLLIAATWGRSLWAIPNFRRQQFGGCFTSTECDPTVTWVDFSSSAPELGCKDFPYHTLSFAVLAVQTNGTLAIKSGTTSEAPTISKPMTIEACGGPVTIGKAP
jgi:hypothetical protein